MNKKLFIVVFLIIFSSLFSISVFAANDAGITVPSYQTSPDGIGNGIPDTGDAKKDRNDDSTQLLNGLTNGFGNVVNGLTNLPQQFITFLMQGFAASSVLELVDFMTGFLDIISNMMSKSDVVFNSAVVSGLALLLRPFAYNIMCLLFMVGITKKAAYMEAMSPYVFFESLGLMMVSKFLVDNSVYLLSLISSINSSATNIVLSYPQGTINHLWNIQNLVKAIENSVTNPFDLIGVNIIVTLSMIILSICMMIIFVVLVSRQIELGVLAIVSPLFMATVASSISNDVFKAFLKHFIGVVFQTLFMAVAIVIFVSSVFSYVQGTGTGIFGGFIEMLIGLIGLSFYIIRMPNSIKHILGMSGGGGSGLSVASFAGLLL